MTYPRSALVLAIALGLAGVASAPNAQVLTTQDDIGGVYEGTFRGGLQHGTGSYRLPNGYEYTGDWVDGEIKGQGVARFPNGSVYEGHFEKGKPEGRGRIVFSDGGIYEGDWTNGVINGQGIAVYANGVRYEGGFKNAQHDGKGVMQSPGGYEYNGDWVDGEKQGAVYHGFIAPQRLAGIVGDDFGYDTHGG